MAKRTSTRRVESSGALDPRLQRRVVIEAIAPAVDGGRFPIKRTPGEQVEVSADVFADGHDVIAVVLLHREQGARAWREASMIDAGNDRWTATFPIERLTNYEYTVEGWVDRFATWRHALSVKVEAGQDVSSELLEGAAIVRDAAVRAGRRPDAARLRDHAAALDNTELPQADRVAVGLSDALADTMRQNPDRRLATRYEPPLQVLVERDRARVGAWYEMFPRSAGTDPTRSATFREAAERLPYIAGMGFDILYLPPLHPIGRSFRKGRNNTLESAPGDPGSPWAIGSDEGGHMAVEPGLGTLDDFDWFVAEARRHGLEVALDIAFQASPDHPYVREHPAWFRHRPDGTIKYAENPPKKYQDIVPFDFESEDWQALWRELVRVFEFWIEHGVTIFRVDNPHTKPFRFWQWALAEIRTRHPETIFLSEAFTRPKVMRRLAKAGFSQSYTYFTWRNTKAELTEYFTELMETPVREYMRPNLFANTPDILHEYLQRGGRPAFEVRFVLAATLGANYGIYSGFELGENTPVRPGSEEYLDSEKYQIKPRDFDRADSIAPLIGRVNAIRRAHPALQYNSGFLVHETDNPHLLCYSRLSPDGSDRLLVIVNLDPANMQHGWIRVPSADWDLPAGGLMHVHDLLSDEQYYWSGDWHYVRLDPQVRVAHILEVRP